MITSLLPYYQLHGFIATLHSGGARNILGEGWIESIYSG